MRFAFGSSALMNDGGGVRPAFARTTMPLPLPDWSWQGAQ